MKKITTILIVFVLFVTIGKANQEFMLYHLNYDFNGSCYFNNKIIVFGNSGDFVISDDMGKNWYREHIFVDTVSIVNLIPDGDYLIGARADGMLFKLDKNYKIVQSKQKYENTQITSLSKYNDSLYSITASNYFIWIFNDNMYNYYEVKFLSNGSSPYYKVVEGRDSSFLAICNNRILSFDIKNLLNIYTLKIDDLQLGKNVNNIYKFESGIYVDIDGKLMKMNQQEYQLTSITNDVTGGVFFENYGQIFNIIRNDESKFNIATLQTNQLVNGNFQNRSIIHYERVISKDFKIKDVKVINQNTLIAVGTYNTIFMSFDGGYTWQPISYLNINQTLKWVNEKIGYFSSPDNQIFRTIDGGATFLPQKNMNDTSFTAIATFPSVIFDADDLGHYYCWNGNNPIYGSDTSKMFNFYITNNYGDNFKTKWLYGLYPKGSSVFFNNGGYSTVRFKGYNIHNLIDDMQNFTYLIKFDYSTIYSDEPIVTKKFIDSTFIFLITNLNETLYTFNVKNGKATISICDNIDLDNWKDLFLFNDFTDKHRYKGLLNNIFFHTQTDNSFSRPFAFTIIDTSDSKNIKIDPDGNIIDGGIKEFKILSTFYIDFTNNIFKLIKKDTLDYEGVLSGAPGNWKFTIKPGYTKTSFSFPFLVDEGRIYFQTYDEGSSISKSFFCETTGIESQNWVPDFSNFQLIDFRKYLRSSSLSLPTIYFHKLSENKYIDGLLILEKGETINKVPEIERKESYLYKYLAYPQPATNELRVKIYTNNFDCFNPESFEIYNSEGVVYKSKNEFTIQQTGIYEAEIIWDCSKYSPGVYFIKLNCDTNKDAIKVIKN